MRVQPRKSLISRLARNATLRCALVSSAAFGMAFLPFVQRTALALALLMALTAPKQLPALARQLLAPTRETELTLTLAHGPLRARRYLPLSAAARQPGIVLLHGVHPRGIDEPRMIEFARTLAAGGLDVLTPELPELLRYDLGGETIAQIRELAALHARQTASPAVGVIGISFAGGLALMAAAEQAADRPIGFVATLGAHDDLLRLCRYYAGEDVRGPDGEQVDVAPHPYGARVMLRQHLARFFDPDDLPVAQRSLDAYLRDRGAQARQLATGLSPAGQTTMRILLDPDHPAELGAFLMQAAHAVRPQLMAASPHGHLSALRVPVFLLHGARDPVIPSIETRYLARELPARWVRETVITKLLRHAEFPEPVGLADTYELVRFLRDLLEAAGSDLRAVRAH
jgi:dienelactone hydrolase